MMKQRIVYSAIKWQPVRNIGLTLGSALRRVVYLRDGGITANWTRTALYVGRFVATLQRRQGWRGVVLYFKACHILLLQSVARNPIKDPAPLGQRVKRARSGIPLIIPIKHRQAILSMDKWTIKIWSSFFWLYRVIDIPGNLKLGSIIKPFEVNYLLVVEMATWFVQFLPVFLEVIKRRELVGQARVSTYFARIKHNTARGKPYLKWEVLRQLLKESGGRMPDLTLKLSVLLLPHFVTRLWTDTLEDLCKELGLKRVPSDSKWYFPGVIKDLECGNRILLTSGPNSAKGSEEGPGPNTRTAIGSILTDLKMIGDSVVWDWVQFLFPGQARYATSIYNSALTVYRELDKTDHADVNTYVQVRHGEDGSRTITDSPLPGFSQRWGLGKLAFIPEAAGKVRVVAMVDYITQMLLRPLHKAIFEILRVIPQDGTFDQHAPVYRLAARVRLLQPYFCYDLSAATDRFPATILQLLLSFICDAKVAKAWRFLLNEREFIVPRRISNTQRVPRNTPRIVKYGAGQPMGAYGHWAVFSLGHHILVQFAAYQAYSTLTWFQNYALLGDDIVIADANVAEFYLALLRAMGVEVGLAKSIVSHNGIVEFAKRLWRVNADGSLVDLSGISLKEIGAAYANPDVLDGLLSHTDVRDSQAAMTRITRLLGLGSRALSRLHMPLSSMRPYIKSLILLITRPGAAFGMESFEQWIAQRGLYSPGILREEEIPRVLVSVKDTLVHRIGTAIGARTEWLEKVMNPLNPETGIDRWLSDKPSVFLSLPSFMEGYGLPVYQGFLKEWIWQPFIEQVLADMQEVLGDFKVWSDPSGIEEGNFSLDEIYRALHRTHDAIGRINTSINLFIRDPGLKTREVKRRARVRSSTVKLWFKLRPVVLSALTRK